MAVFLTQNSPGLRTSPVKRGYWVVRRVLGEYIPPPPPTVPALPKDESQLGDLTLRQALARHRQDPACAGCHARFDCLRSCLRGIWADRRAAFSGPGREAHRCARALPRRNGTRRRRRTSVVHRRKTAAGLRIDTLDRKLYAYALGRTLRPSDGPALNHISQRMAAEQYRFGTLVDAIVTSRQFRYRRASAPSDLPPSTPNTLARN